ncbi:MAG: SLC13 family permease [Candidatus Electryonea clarkiae]|nr:SLC13 family permease [Candidatus Electryonea clarkiae]MDP8287045.1 SLC13 family permease [Candidatus Electryonea clarkiae]
MPKLLLVDDEDKFRTSLARRLNLRGYETITLDNGTEAVKVVRGDPEIDVVILDRKMPGVSGEQVLKEIKEFRPELQVIFLTGHGSVKSAMEAGRLEAYTYLEKPCDHERLIEVIEAARADKARVMERHEIPNTEKGSFLKWVIGSHNSRPAVIVFGLLIFLGILLIPTPQKMKELLSAPKTGTSQDLHLGYASYNKLKIGESITDYYARTYKLGNEISTENNLSKIYQMTIEQSTFRAKAMLGTLVIAALFWATGAMPVGITALLVGVSMYLLGIMSPDDVAKAYAKDAVIFIFGVLALARVISKTGLDRRIGLLLLGPANSLPRLLFIFLPLMAIACSFISEHALVAFIMPMFMLVYITSTQREGIKKDHALAVIFVLSLCFAANCGGPGSPVAGGRNAVMIGILADYGVAPTFGQWVMYGLPFVPVMALVIGLYFFITMRRKIKVKELDVASIIRQASNKIGPINRKEYITAAVLVGLILLWITTSDTLGMGGPVIMALVVLNIFRILRWKDVAGIHWEVVALYAGACAMGKGLACTGAALYLADAFINVLPEFMSSGTGLAIATSLFTGITTNFMSDGATVSAIGPITVPMAMIADTNPLMIGLATAFASSFAHMLIIGTPNNAIAYAMAKDPVTGEQLVTLADFLKHGTVVLLLSFAVLWFWTFLGYWRWIGF